MPQANPHGGVIIDICVTIPKLGWDSWLGEGTLPGEEPPTIKELIGEESDPPGFRLQFLFWIGNRKPARIEPGERVYVACGGLIRGYAPLVEVRYHAPHGRYSLVRAGGAVAVTPICRACDGVGAATRTVLLGGTMYGSESVRCAECVGLGFLRVPGFRGFRYRWWSVSDEVPFPEWRTLGF